MGSGSGMILIIASAAAVGILLFVLLMYRYVRRGSPRAAVLSSLLFGAALSGVAGFTVIQYDQIGAGLGQQLIFESYGMLLDLLVIGVFLVALFEWRMRRRDIERYHDEIDDLRGWRSPLASHRIRGSILRLNRRQVSRIDLTRCYLRNMNLSSMDLSGARIVGTDFQNAYLSRTMFREADLQGADLRHAFLWRADLRKATLWSANMKDATLEGADLSRALLKDADLTAANLKDADLTQTRGLTLDQLAKVRTLHHAKLDPELAAAVAAHHPELLEEPEGS
ncbi:hypothetical protein D3OALGB2SA_675 [Olavius algarvensis associated proteobacterium Delta 3]|nr:hypothetical protein D3OALGB2SA_675 [Olavius algarvensis associated proteobacterium Delta 3]